MQRVRGVPGVLDLGARVGGFICPEHKRLSAVDGRPRTGPNETRTETRFKINLKRLSIASMRTRI